MKMNINLICLPFAGGSCYSYNSLQQCMPSHISMKAFDLPGRGHRVHEQLLGDAMEVTERLYQAVKHLLREPYAIFGHSMGSLLGFLLTRKIIDNNNELPLHLFFSGREGPSWRDPAIYSHLPSREFFQALQKLGGCPPQLLQDEELQEFFEPILRSDFELVETYRHTSSPPFHIPMDIFYGAGEDICQEGLYYWNKETTAPVEYTMFEGDHFFLLSDPLSTASAIIKQLDKYVYNDNRKCILKA
jgi:surfactin synthase thioesterase subunit